MSRNISGRTRKSSSKPSSGSGPKPSHVQAFEDAWPHRWEEGDKVMREGREGRVTTVYGSQSSGFQLAVQWDGDRGDDTLEVDVSTLAWTGEKHRNAWMAPFLDALSEAGLEGHVTPSVVSRSLFDWITVFLTEEEFEGAYVSVSPLAEYEAQRSDFLVGYYANPEGWEDDDGDVREVENSAAALTLILEIIKSRAADEKDSRV